MMLRYLNLIIDFLLWFSSNPNYSLNVLAIAADRELDRRKKIQAEHTE
jgi:hypothetical protein